jgi:hypothetical protein
VHLIQYFRDGGQQVPLRCPTGHRQPPIARFVGEQPPYTVLISNQRGVIPRMRRQLRNKPVQLPPRPVSAEKVVNIHTEERLQVVFDGLAVLIDQRREAREPPGNCCTCPKLK